MTTSTPRTTDAEQAAIYAQEIMNLERENAQLRAALKELIKGAVYMDRELLVKTGSPYECERADITAARKALETH